MFDVEEKSHRQIGSEGENQAVNYLKSKGYEIVKQNFHFGKLGEIDIVARQRNELVFIEVKYRTSHTFGDPLESITPKKQSMIRLVAEGYYYVNKLNNVASRFDVIIIDKTSGETVINHLENAF